MITYFNLVKNVVDYKSKAIELVNLKEKKLWLVTPARN
jgi:hypothetical protein